VREVRITIDKLPLNTKVIEKTKKMLKKISGDTSDVFNANIQEILSLATINGDDSYG
jgi:hypothetical protein